MTTKKEEKLSIKNSLTLISNLLSVVLVMLFAKFFWIDGFFIHCLQLTTTMDYIILIIYVISSFFAFIILLFFLAKNEEDKEIIRPRTFDERFYGPSFFDDNSSDPDSPTLGEFICFLLLLIALITFVVSLTILIVQLII